MSVTTAKSPSDKRTVRADDGLELKEILDQEVFRRMISLERKRSERTQRPFVLLLMDTGRTQPTEKNGQMLLDILSALQSATRETDIMGWYETNAAVGVMFTEITLENNLILSTILARISDVLRGRLTSEQFSQIKFSFHLFPEEWDSNNPERQSNPTLYPDLHKRNGANRLGHRILKRGMDIVGSLFLLLALLASIFRDRRCHQVDFARTGSVPSATHRRTRNGIHFPEVPLDVRQQRCQPAQGIRPQAHCRPG